MNVFHFGLNLALTEEKSTVRAMMRLLGQTFTDAVMGIEVFRGDHKAVHESGEFSFLQ